MNKKIIVADASPLIAFARIDKLSLLNKTLGTLIIPSSVRNECLEDSLRFDSKVINNAINNKLIKVYGDPDTQEYHELIDILDLGETAAIALAIKLQAGLLIDEKLGRNAAKNYNLKIIGTVGTLLLAKKKKLIDKVGAIITELKNVGYYLSDELIKQVLKHAKEP